MGALIPDELLESFAVIAPWDELPSRLLAQYGGIVDRLIESGARAVALQNYLLKPER